MRIVLIWPKGFDIKYMVPMSLAYLKSNLPGVHDVEILDCSLRNIDSNSPEFIEIIERINPQVVGVSCYSQTYIEAVNIFKRVKSLNKKIVTVMGGPHATSYPNKTIKNEYLDFLFRGEAELSFPVFLEELEKPSSDWSKVYGLTYLQSDGTIAKNDTHREKQLDKIKIPDYDAIHLQEYLDKGYRYNTKHKRNAPIWATRGCPYRCQFCSAPILNGKLVRSHSIDYLIAWIKYLYYEKDIKLFNIIDDNFTLNVKYAKNFCKKIIALNIKDMHFSTPNGIRIQKSDTELFELMKKAGWDYVIIAPESGSADTLKNMKKDLDINIIPRKVKQICNIGLKVHGLFMIGYPGETIKDIGKTQDFLRKCKFDMVFIANFQPLPGTPVYDELVKNGEIEDGLLPGNVSDGERVYTPESLKGFNFPKFVLLNYLYVMLKNPKNIVYMLTLINPKMLIIKAITNLKNMCGR